MEKNELILKMTARINIIFEIGKEVGDSRIMVDAVNLMRELSELQMLD